MSATHGEAALKGEGEAGTALLELEGEKQGVRKPQSWFSQRFCGGKIHVQKAAGYVVKRSGV